MRICVVGAGPCGLAAVKNLLEAGLRDVVCYDEGPGIGGNWAFTDDPGRAGVHAGSRPISSRRLSSFVDFPMPATYPDFPSHRQLLAYFSSYAQTFGLESHIHSGSRVEWCEPDHSGQWRVQVSSGGERRVERYDQLVVCAGHHRDPVLPACSFAGSVVHSSAYRRPDPYRDQRVLVVGAGNSAADIAVDVSRLAARTALSMRAGAYVVPNRIAGRPVDAVHAYWRGRVPRPLLRLALRGWLRLAVGPWANYGLPRPAGAPLARPPIVSSDLLAALRERRVIVRSGIERYDGQTIHFRDSPPEPFDAVILATGFRPRLAFLPDRFALASGLYLRMMHPTLPNLYVIGQFQPIGCIWRLADLQARVAARLISGELRRPADVEALARRDGGDLEVDYHAFERQLRRLAHP